MKKILYILFALSLLAGCDYNEEYFDGYDDTTVPTDVKQIEYTLTDEDYATVSSNNTNKALAEAAGVSAELTALKTTKTFTATLPAATYLPAFIASKWTTADEKSAVKMTYNEGIPTPAYVTELSNIPMYRVTAADYQSVWGEGSPTNFFTPATTANANLPAILTQAFPDAQQGTIVAVDYNISENEPAGTVIAVNEDFNIFTATVKPIVLSGWNHVAVTGTGSSPVWEGRMYKNNGYMQATAYTADGGMDAYMITPEVAVESGMKLTFDACYGNYKAEGGRLQVLVSSDLAGFTPDDVTAANWDNITSGFTIPVPSGPYGTLAPVGEYDLSEYAGQDVYVAFRYIGDKATSATTTIQVDNVVVKSGGGENVYNATSGLYTYNGTVWAAYSGNGLILTKADYTVMGLNYDNFSGTQSDHYIPTFLNLKFPYAQDGDIKVVTYKYYAGSTTIAAAEYVHSASGWVKAAITETVTSQYVLSDGKWKFDPSVVITLMPVRVEENMKYFQAIVDYVAATFGAGYYETNRTNAEFYYGASAYYNNISFRFSDWRNGHANGTQYADLSDAELEALQYERLKEAFIPALKANHSDMKPVEGVTVTCTVNFVLYTSVTLSAPNYTIQYEVVGPGEFKYIEDSLKPL